MKLLGIVLAVQVAIGLTLVVLVATDNVPFVGDDAANGKAAPAATVDNFDGRAAFRLLRRQVEMGPRPAGSPQSRRLAALIKRVVPRGRYQEVPDGLRNVIGTVRGREPGYIVVGAHYDTKDIDGFVGANDGASGTAVALQLARTLRRPKHTIHYVFLDGEETPRGVPDSEFLRYGVRGAKVAAPVFRDARAMILLDFVGDKELTLRREGYSDARLWKRLRETANRVGAGSVFPSGLQGGVLDDHIPFRKLGVRTIDLIDFDFPCWHRRCDNMSAVSQRSVDAVGETVYEFLRGL